MQILDFPELSKQLLQIFFTGFLMDVGDQNNPAFDGPYSDGAGGSAGFSCGIGGGRRVVNIHFGRHLERRKY